MAIKALRKGVPGCGLKEAKWAIDRMLGRRKFGPLIKLFSSIKSININVGEGDIELDLEGLELKALSNIEKLGISEIRRILDLHEILMAWDTGKKITVHENECVND